MPGGNINEYVSKLEKLIADAETLSSSLALVVAEIKVCLKDQAGDGAVVAVDDDQPAVQDDSRDNDQPVVQDDSHDNDQPVVQDDSHDNDQPIAQDDSHDDNDQPVTNNDQSPADNNQPEDKTNDDADDNDDDDDDDSYDDYKDNPTINARYTVSFNTQKSNKPYSFNSFKKKMLDHPAIWRFISHFGKLGVITEKRLGRFVPAEYREMVLTPLLRDGYLTRITNNDTFAKSYCVSEKGLELFKGKGLERMKQVCGTRNKYFYPISDRELDENKFRIERHINMEDLVIFASRIEEEILRSIRTVELRSDVIGTVPYVEVTSGKEDHKRSVLIVMQEIIRYVSEKKAAKISKSADAVLFYDPTGRAEPLEPERLAMFAGKELFYAVTRESESGDEEDAKFYFTDTKGEEYDLEDIFIDLSYMDDDEDDGDINNDNGGGDADVVSEGGGEGAPDIVSSGVTLKNGRTGQYAIMKLLTEKRVTEAAVLSKTLSFAPVDRNPFGTFYKLLSYAANLGIDPPFYSVNDIDELELEVSVLAERGIFPGETLRLLRLSALAWALILPGNTLYEYKDHKGKAAADMDSAGETVPSLKAVFMKLFGLMDIINDLPNGFGPDVVSAFCGGGGSVRNKDLIARVRDEIVAKMRDTRREIKSVRKKFADISGASDQEAVGKMATLAGLEAVNWSFERICGYLNFENSAPVHDKWHYIDFLRTCHIALNDKYTPELDADIISVPNYEPWNRVLAHIETPENERVDLKDVLNLIEADEKPDFNWFKNYRTAEIIRKYLHEKEGGEYYEDMYSGAKEQAKADYAAQREIYESELNYIFYNGCIDADDLNYALKLLDDYGERFSQRGDLARHSLLRGAILEMVRGFMKKRRGELEERLGEFVKKHVKNVPEIKEIVDSLTNNALENGQYLLAKTLIEGFEKGRCEFINKEFWEDDVSKVTDILKTFLDDYNALRGKCIDNENDGPLDAWGMRAISDKTSAFTKERRSVTLSLIKSWPKDNGVSGEELGGFFGQFGIAVKNIIDRRDATANRLIVTFEGEPEKKSGDKELFGIDTRSPITAACAFGDSTSDELKAFLTENKESFAKTVFFIVDKPLLLKTRKELAALLKSEMDGRAVLIIDRVLMLYIAALDKAKWTRALLMCTLPYSCCTPYAEDVCGNSAYMYFGNETDVKETASYKGPALICGAPGSGKTALLKRAQSVTDDPERNTYAVLIDAKRKTKEEVLHAISDELVKIGIIGGAADTLSNLCKALEAKIGVKGKDASKLQIYIDGADRFLHICAADGYADLVPFENLRKKYPDRFKAVFTCVRIPADSKRSGLLRASHKTLKPLTLLEGKEMILTPFAYLGIHFEATSHILQMLLAVDYTPGILRMFCEKLLESSGDRYLSLPYTMGSAALSDGIHNGQLNKAIAESKDAAAQSYLDQTKEDD